VIALPVVSVRETRIYLRPVEPYGGKAAQALTQSMAKYEYDSPANIRVKRLQYKIAFKVRLTLL
jgi:hypothetical protein